MSPGRFAAMALSGGRPWRTMRLRLTLWYGGLFLVSGTAPLAVTYGLVVQGFVGNTAKDALCATPGGPGSVSAGSPDLCSSVSTRISRSCRRALRPPRSARQGPAAAGRRCRHRPGREPDG